MPATRSLSLATPTLARIYARQGLTDRARQIYLQLLEDRPGDPELEAALAQLEAATSMDPTSADGGPDAGIDRATRTSRVALKLSADAIECTWIVSELGYEGAESLLSGGGQLTLRSLWFKGDEVTLRDDQSSQRAGRLSIELSPRAQVVTVAIGLLAADGRFAAIAHASKMTCGKTD